MKVSLVTGGAGFIGSHVAKKLIESGHRVVVLDDLSGGFVENIPEKAEFIQGSITDHELIKQIFSKNRFDYVFHLAAYAAEGLSHFIKRFNYTNNLIGSVNLINESIINKVKCFVFTSSIAVYGKGQLPMHEELIPQPEDPYGIAKLAVEQELKVSHEMFGMDYIIFRPHNVYGEHQNIGDRYRNVVGIFINQVMQNKPLTIFGDGSQTRAFSYIDDVAPHIANSVDNKKAYNKIFNIGAEDEFSVNKLAQTVLNLMGSKAEINYLPARNEVLHAYSDHTRAKEYFGINSAVSLEDGLKKMIDWAKKHGARKTPSFENIEIIENLPEIWK
ncbi:MAG: NAD-dependent epimerase/dehydratase family protein [Bacteroidales bacterium]|nr:NAD-dependent epimerase/dehydratase family protein [Bacteroidales bacterium]